MKKKIKVLIALLVVLSLSISAQNLTQTLRGRVIDIDSKISIVGANVIIENSEPLLGASTDIDGYFAIKNVPIGRVKVKVSSLSYEPQILSNIVIETGKEAFLNIKLRENFKTLEVVTIKAKRAKDEAINSMSMISNKTVTVEETGRYAGSLSDPARMVSSFAGVVNSAYGDNNIVVRGNSPRGILWRLEGIEIPNPNHLSGEASTGGPVNSLNASMLANSDFFSGAFSADYGNALSGVFDTQFRNGNSEKREHSISLGVIGLDASTEGYFHKDYNGSYLLNVRNSSLELMDRTGIIDYGGIPRYKDASFKINLPTKKFGVFSAFGLLGASSMSMIEVNKEAKDTTQASTFRSGLSIVGLKHNYILNEKTYLQSYISYANNYNGSDFNILDRNANELYPFLQDKFNENKYRFSTTINKKLNSRHTLKTGVIYTLMAYNMISEYNPENIKTDTLINAKGNTAMIQAYSTWKYRFRENFSLVSGIHYTQLFLNNNYAIEPRLSVKWDLNNRQNLSLGFGLHSRLESLSVYMSTDGESQSKGMNEDLELTKAMHLVLGYAHQFSENIFFKTEFYYQYLYDVPVENKANSTMSMINSTSGYTNIPLINKGSGRNYGAEFTLERFFNNNYYYMATASLYQSKYTAMDKVERDSKYNANYAFNLMFGKEFHLPTKKKNKTLALNIRSSFLGGNRYTPIDLEASILAAEEVYYPNSEFSKKADDVFFLNLGLTYRVNRKKTTHELKLDIQNITNNSATVLSYYDIPQQEIHTVSQLTLIPNIMYVVKF